MQDVCSYWFLAIPHSKVHGANIGPIWGRQDRGGPHVCPMDFAVWDGSWVSRQLWFGRVVANDHQIWATFALRYFIHNYVTSTKFHHVDRPMIACSPTDLFCSSRPGPEIIYHTFRLHKKRCVANLMCAPCVCQHRCSQHDFPPFQFPAS